MHIERRTDKLLCNYIWNRMAVATSFLFYPWHPNVIGSSVIGSAAILCVLLVKYVANCKWIGYCTSYFYTTATSTILSFFPLYKGWSWILSTTSNILYWYVSYRAHIKSSSPCVHLINICIMCINSVNIYLT